MERITRKEFETSLKTVIEGMRQYLYFVNDCKVFEETNISYDELKEVYITLKDIYEVI